MKTILAAKGPLEKKSKPSKIEDWLSFTQSEQSELRMKNVPCDTVTQNKDALAKTTVLTPLRINLNQPDNLSNSTHHARETSQTNRHIKNIYILV